LLRLSRISTHLRHRSFHPSAVSPPLEKGTEKSLTLSAQPQELRSLHDLRPAIRGQYEKMLVSGDEIVRTRSGSALDDPVIRRVGLNHRKAVCWGYRICKSSDFHACFLCFGWRPPELGLQHVLNFIQNRRRHVEPNGARSGRIQQALGRAAELQGAHVHIIVQSD
jgi:hypothetical protein